MDGKHGKIAVVNASRLLPGIHGLRGIAALAVVIYHLVLVAKISAPEGFGFIVRDFGLSVHLFFMLSAFSLMHSTENRVGHVAWVKDYFIRRFFRIAPLFYAVLAFELLRQGGGVRLMVDIDRVITNVSFMFGLVPFTSIVWGGWSIGVEMLFYMIFPVIILCNKSHKAALLFMVVSIIISCNVRSLMHAEHVSVPATRWEWSYFAFIPNFFIFMMGCYAYRMSRSISSSSALARWIVPSLAVMLLVALIFGGIGRYFKNDGRLDIVVWGVAFMLLCVWQSIRPSKLIANKFFEYFGERSFSIYLLHPIVMHFSAGRLADVFASVSVYVGSYAYFVCALLVIALVMVAAEITYRLIEIPGIELGKKIIAKSRVDKSENSSVVGAG